MAAQNDVGQNVEIRKLDYLHRQRLGQLLDSNDSWKGLMAEIPLTFRPVRSPEKRFNFEDIRLGLTYLRLSFEKIVLH